MSAGRLPLALALAAEHGARVEVLGLLGALRPAGGGPGLAPLLDPECADAIACVFVPALVSDGDALALVGRAVIVAGTIDRADAPVPEPPPYLVAERVRRASAGDAPWVAALGNAPWPPPELRGSW